MLFTEKQFDKIIRNKDGKINLYYEFIVFIPIFISLKQVKRLQE